MHCTCHIPSQFVAPEKASDVSFIPPSSHLAFISTETDTFPPNSSPPSLSLSPKISSQKMGGMTKLALGATITVALIFALFLTLFLLLLADFISSLARTRKDPEDPNPMSPPDFPLKTSKPATLPSFYAHGVLQAPTSFLLTVPKLEAAAAPPIKPASPASMRCSLSSDERFVCISNPVYDGAQAQEEEEEENGTSTPFETPGTSPSHFGEEGEWSPPLRFMKKLPPVRAWLPGSASATETNWASWCSFSSDTHCFSPSWRFDLGKDVALY